MESTVAVSQLDAALAAYEEAKARAKYNDLSDLGQPKLAELMTTLGDCVRRLAPPDSEFAKLKEACFSRWAPSPHVALPQIVGIARALREAYASGYLSSIQELVHAEVFSNYLDMAAYLLAEHFKDPAAVLGGATLESHLRSMAAKWNISIDDGTGNPRKSSVINDDLKKAGAYHGQQQKSVTAWLGLRNDAAHGHFDRYTAAQVENLLAAVRVFIMENPA
jgi:hypothetical protein